MQKVAGQLQDREAQVDGKPQSSPCQQPLTPTVEPWLPPQLSCILKAWLALLRAVQEVWSRPLSEPFELGQSFLKKMTCSSLSWRCNRANLQRLPALIAHWKTHRAKQWGLSKIIACWYTKMLMPSEGPHLAFVHTLLFLFFWLNIFFYSQIK
jgi:hypothetical protein